MKSNLEKKNDEIEIQENISDYDENQEENYSNNSEEESENSFLRESLPRDYLLQEINRLKPLNEAKKMAELEKIKHESDLVEISLREKQKHDEALTQELEKLRISIGIKEEDIITCQKTGKSLSEKSKASQSEFSTLQAKVKAQREKLETFERRDEAMENENEELKEVSPLL